MAAPEQTIEDMRTAVARPAPYAAPAQAEGYPPGGHRWGAPPPPYAYHYGYGYGYPPPLPPQQPAVSTSSRYDDGFRESAQLSRLRTAGVGASSCKLPDADYSEPDVASFDGGEVAADDLDMASQEALSQLQLPDFNVAISNRAIKYVRFLTRTNRGRGLFTAWLKRSGRYVDLIQQTLREWQLPEDLMWVAMIESGFDPAIKSPAGAMGLWQFMRPTGEVYGLQVTRFSDDRKNPVQATRAAAHHLRDLYQRFGSWDLAFAAYNMGYEQLLDRIDRYGTTDFNELSRQRALPRETAAYVPKIVAAALVANNLERYGFEDVKLYEPIHYSELAVPGGTELSVIAKAAGIPVNRLRKLNPHLITKHVPPGSDYVVMIPPESLSRARVTMPAMIDGANRRVALSNADILLPDDLLGLSGKAKNDHIANAWTEDENLLRNLPKPKRRSLRAMLGREPEVADAEPKLEAVAEEFAPKREDRETVMYRVGGGDTLIGVARQFAVDIDDLAHDNDIEPDAQLREGALLRILVKPKVLERWKKQSGADAQLSKSKKKKKKKSES